MKLKLIGELTCNSEEYRDILVKMIDNMKLYQTSILYPNSISIFVKDTGGEE